VAEGGPVLVVEDDESIARIVAGVLADEGYPVVVARDGAEALERIAAQPPRLILLDMRMPRVNGWEFTAAYRARTDAPAPIVVITAGRDAAQKAREIGADGYVAKPFDIDDVVDIVTRVVGAP
jgi:CheY-like chemotaxis protein